MLLWWLSTLFFAKKKKGFFSHPEFLSKESRGEAGSLFLKYELGCSEKVAGSTYRVLYSHLRAIDRAGKWQPSRILEPPERFIDVRAKRAKFLDLRFYSKSNLPNKRIGIFTAFREKTLIDVLWLFLASKNYFNWLTWFLVLLRTERQESRKSIEIIFTAQK